MYKLCNLSPIFIHYIPSKIEMQTTKLFQILTLSLTEQEKSYKNPLLTPL